MIACLFSGGKDSTLALHKAVSAGKKVGLLITMRPDSADSYMFHKPNVDFTNLQAEALGISQALVVTKGEKEKELTDLEAALVDNSVEEIITGAVASEYQNSRIDAMCKRHSILHTAPLWGIDPMEELNELARSYKVIITKVAAEGLDSSFLGQEIDQRMIKRLEELQRRNRINMLFEGGEAESFVLDAPLFKRRIEVINFGIVEKSSSAEYVIKEARLVDK
ncbi:MAG: diphthine--ammonia ligase [Candidatus Micrarchaeota archaeon]|nr:diphthine--ammonia ligase [Candidatus Micrarchaeota archaeon]